jgi:hypothetical protein
MPAPAPIAPPWNGKTNGFAIACLTLSLVGCGGVLSVVFGVVALVQTRRNGDRRGRRFAIAGLTITGLWLLAIGAFIGVAVVRDISDGPDRNAAGVVNGERSIRLTDLRAGDCLKDIDEQTGNYVDVVPCTTPHTTEVFAMFDLPSGAWPGAEQVQKVADDGCDQRFGAYSDVKPDEDGYTLLAAPPEELAWPGERGVLCLAHNPRNPTTGSVRR